MSEHVSRGFRCGRLAREAAGHVATQGVQAGTLAQHLQQSVALQRRDHHVAAQGHLGVVDATEQLAQAGGARAQGVELAHIAQRLGQVYANGDQVGVLAHHDQGAAAEGFGLLAHLADGAALVGVERDQAGELGIQGGEGAVDLCVVGLGEGEGNEVLRHLSELSSCLRRCDFRESDRSGRSPSRGIAHQSLLY